MGSLNEEKDKDAVNGGCETIDAKVYLKPDPKWMVVCSICSSKCFFKVVYSAKKQKIFYRTNKIVMDKY